MNRDDFLDGFEFDDQSPRYEKIKPALPRHSISVEDRKYSLPFVGYAQKIEFDR